MLAPVPGLRLFGISLEQLSGIAQFLILSSAICFIFITHAVLLEQVTREGFKFPWSSTAIECCWFSILALLEVSLCRRQAFDVQSVFHGESFRTAFRSYLFVAASLAVGRGLTMVSVATLSFPMAILLKTSKILVVMVLGVCFFAKHFSPSEYGAAIFVASGLVMFSMADARSGGEDSVVGLCAGVGALFADSLVSNLQEKTLRILQRPIDEMLMITNFVGGVLMVLVALFSGEASLFLQFTAEKPMLTFSFVIFATLGFFGAKVWAQSIHSFGAVATTGIGLSRKLVNILLSFVLFPKPLHLLHIAGIMVFFAGVGWSWNKQRTGARGAVQMSVRADTPDSKV